MKKRIFVYVAAALLLFGLLFVYVFIPGIIELKAEEEIRVTESGLHRMLVNEKSIEKWWPGVTSNNEFSLNGNTYTFHDNTIALLPVLISDLKTNTETQLVFIPLPQGTLRVAWVGKMATSYNPFKRVQLWVKASALQRDLGTILERMKPYYEKQENIYGIRIKPELVKDTVLISTAAIYKGAYPDNHFIYQLISRLKEYAALNKIQSSGFPMLNIDSIDSISYNVRVAIPIDRVIPARGDILLKRMPGRGNILVAEVKGGEQTARKAFDQVIQYAKDHQRSFPGIPFYSLVTDRSKVVDTAQWITRIYCPVM